LIFERLLNHCYRIVKR